MTSQFDPSLNFLYSTPSPLDCVFSPRAIALIGASETPGSVGRTLMQNLMTPSFLGKLYPINPKRSEILGISAYPDILSAPSLIDLAVIATPAKTIPKIIEDCVKKKIPAAVIISAGFKEMGKEGLELELQVLEAARKGKMRLIGPNCLGVMCPANELNATFAAGIALKGNIAFISQSGALCTAVLDWSLKEKVGFSAFVSIGSMADIDWGDLIDYFGNDPATQSILLYVESIGDARRFLSAARQVALLKPIILIKAGRSVESAKAAASHTGSLAGSDEVLSAALNRVGVLRVDTIADLFSMAQVLAKQARPKGPHLTIVTNAGGPGVIATDSLIQYGGKITELSSETIDAYNQILSPSWSHNNPVDILGDATAETYAKAIEIAAKDNETDGILVILTPQDMTDPTATAKNLKAYGHLDKPILASWMGAEKVEEGARLLNQFGIPTFSFPDLACKTFALLWRYTYNLRSIYEVPTFPFEELDEHLLSWQARRDIVEPIFKKAQEEGRTILDEYESKIVIEAYEIPIVPTFIAKTEEKAAQLAEKIGYPVVLKLYSKTITHKTDVGGVKLHLMNSAAVEEAYREIQASVKAHAKEGHFEGVTVQPMIIQKEGYELILGSTTDEQFGPVLLFGLGGQLVEVFQDRALALPPLTSTLAVRLMEQTKIYAALKGVRGKKAVDLVQLEHVLIRFSQFILECPEIQECDINPLLASSDQLIALDARIILHEKGRVVPQPAIRPYPTQYVEVWNLSEGIALLCRPIRPEDEALLVEFHRELSEDTVRQRFLKALHYDERVAHERLSQICFNDYEREIAVVVENVEENRRKIIAVGRFSKLPGTDEATFAFIVSDQWQHKGVGTKLMEKILEIAKREKIHRVIAKMLPENLAMQTICRHFGFSITRRDSFIFAELELAV